jgi:hypothetical protein
MEIFSERLYTILDLSRAAAENATIGPLAGNFGVPYYDPIFKWYFLNFI